MLMNSMLERQRMTNRRLSLNREKLKQYCGQLNLELIPENPSMIHLSPRDQMQIVPNSYRSHRFNDYLAQFQQQQMNSTKNHNHRKSQSNAHHHHYHFNSNRHNIESNQYIMNKESSSLTLGSAKTNQTHGYPLQKQVSINLPNFLDQERTTIAAGDAFSQLPEDFSIKMPDTAMHGQSRIQPMIMVQNHNYSPRQYEEGTGKMSPLSQVKKLLKGDIEDLKRKANQTFFKELTKKQIQVHEDSLKKRSSQDSLDYQQVDPVVYYENRYFPFGFDDPEKLNNYHRQQANQSKISGKTSGIDSVEKSQMLDQIQAFEKKCDLETEKEIQFSIEQEYDRRQLQQDKTNSTTRYSTSVKNKQNNMSATKYGTDNKGFMEKYLSATGVMIGGLNIKKVERHSNLLNKSLVRGGFNQISLPGSPSVSIPQPLQQWAASGNNISAYVTNNQKSTDAKQDKFAGKGGLIMSGETVLGANEEQQMNRLSPRANGTNNTINFPSVVAAPNNQTTTLFVNERNLSINKLKSTEQQALSTMMNFRSTQNSNSFRRSRDLREELTNQRIATSLRLESLNIKVPNIWRQKEEAYLRFKEMKNSMQHSNNNSSFIKPQNISPRNISK